MTLQSLLIKGVNNPSKLERFADGALALPRVMWLNRKVTIETNQFGAPELKSESRSMKRDPDEHKGESGYGLLGVGIVLLVGSILALPFLLVGTICKQIALSRSPKAKEFNQIAQFILSNRKKLDTQESLERQIGRINKKIADNRNKIHLLNTSSEGKDSIQKAKIRVDIAVLDLKNEQDIDQQTKLSQELTYIKQISQPIHEQIDAKFRTFLIHFPAN